MTTIEIQPPTQKQIEEYKNLNMPTTSGLDLVESNQPLPLADINLGVSKTPMSDNYGTLYNMLYQPFAGANDILTKLPDELINVGAEIGEKLGFVRENETSRNYLNRLFNSNDYETKKVLIPYILSYGQGEKVDPSGGVAKTLRGIGEGTALTLPITGGFLRKG